MLIRNLNPTNGLCNVTRLICKKIIKTIILTDISTGQLSCRLIARISLHLSDNEALSFKFLHKQFSIRLNFTITINKSQSQIISNVEIYLPHHIFSHCQLYVALSRGISMKKNQNSYCIRSMRF